jgi:AmmeMemoRadiSam system protein A
MASEREIHNLTGDEQQVLLRLARQAIEAAACGDRPLEVDLASLPPSLREAKACFVTLHKQGALRGCTGVLVARSPLAREVIHTAAQTALSDPRFVPVTSEEVPELEIEISVLTPPQHLDVPSPEALPRLIRPGVDGVTLIKGPYRATFLPQVWDRVPDPVTFLDMLCEKMGLPPRSWLVTPMEVEVYQVEEFSEHQAATG